MLHRRRVPYELPSDLSLVDIRNIFPPPKKNLAFISYTIAKANESICLHPCSVHSVHLTQRLFCRKKVISVMVNNSFHKMRRHLSVKKATLLEPERSFKKKKLYITSSSQSHQYN